MCSAVGPYRAALGSPGQGSFLGGFYSVTVYKTVPWVSPLQTSKAFRMAAGTDIQTNGWLCS